MYRWHSKEGFFWIVWCTSVSIFCTLITIPCLAQTVGKAESLKAYYVCQFVTFISWERHEGIQENKPVLVGLLGEDIFKGELELAVEALKEKGRNFKIVQANTPEELTNCHIVCVGMNLGEDFDKAIDTLHAAGVVTVCDGEGAAERGGMINFTLKNQKVRFEINLEATKAAEVKISSQLLKLAANIIEKTVILGLAL